MSVLRYYLRDTQTNVGTGGIIFDLSLDVGTSSPNSESENSNAFTEVAAWQQKVNNFIGGTSFPYSFNISSISGTLEYRFRLQRVDSSNVVQASSSYSTTYSTVGIKTGTFTFSTAWNFGDRLRVSLEIRRSGGHGNVTVTINLNDSATYVDASIAYYNNFITMF